MSMSFQEKSLWLMLGGLVACLGWYFWTVLPNDGGNVLPHQIVLLAGGIALLVAVQVAGNVIIAIVDRQPETDERDRAIDLKGTRNGAYVLAAGVATALWIALVTEGNFAFTHVLLGSWVLAEVVGIGSRLVMYRRGA